MTTMTTSGQTTTGPGAIAGIGAGSALVAIAFTAVGAHDWTEIGVIAAVVVLATALVHGLVVPRALGRESAGGTALALSVPAAALVVPAFWSGLPLVLGVAGVVVGNHGRHARSGGFASILGMALGALAVIAYVTIYVSDAMNGGAGFLFD